MRKTSNLIIIHIIPLLYKLIQSKTVEEGIEDFNLIHSTQLGINEDKDISKFQMGNKNALLRKNSFLVISLDEFTTENQTYSGDIIYNIQFQMKKTNSSENSSYSKDHGVRLFTFDDNEYLILYHRFKRGDISLNETFRLNEKICNKNSSIPYDFETNLTLNHKIDLQKFEVTNQIFILDSSILCGRDKNILNDVIVDFTYTIQISDKSDQYLKILRCNQYL